MEISNNQSWYINPNTRQLTSNVKNTVIKDREAFNGSMQNLLNPVEDLVQVLKTPIKLAERSSLNRQGNSVDIASGSRIAVNDGYILTVKPQGVEVSGGDNPYDTQAYLKAQKMADSLATLLRNACGNMHTVAYSQEEYARWNEGVSDVMGYLGIDASKDFTVNGMKYSRNENGQFESQANSEAKTAPEEQHVFEGAIPAIVDEETWQTVQKIRETVRRAPKRQNAPNRLTGLLYCADCGSKLTHRYNLVQDRWKPCAPC